MRAPDAAATDALGLQRRAATDTGATLVVTTHDRRVTDGLPGAHVLRLGAAAAPSQVKSSRPVTFSQEAVTVRGKMSVLPSDPYGMFYRLADGRW